MTTILAHLKLRPGKSPAFEAIARDMVAQTVANEPDCLRYEYWRGHSPDSYYVLLAFKSSQAFYEHQASDWHERHTPGLQECWETISLEILDPVPSAGPLPQTRPHPLAADSPAALHEHARAVPIGREAWWDQLDEQRRDS